jgi:hypothetical protein
MRQSRRLTLLAGLLFLAPLGLAQMPAQVRIIIDNANIRSKPALDAEILDIAAKGTLFDVVDKAGSWYTIRAKEDQTGQPVYGYIHESMAEPVRVPAPEPPAVAEPVPVPEPPPPLQELPSSPPKKTSAQVKMSPNDKPLSGSFIKYGFGDHWLASFGFDLGIGRHFGLGLEIQPYYNRDTDIDLSVLQLDFFVNAKLGFNLWWFTFFGGGGLGPDFSFTIAEVEGQSSSTFKTRLAYHGILGLALNIGGVAVVFEFQPIMVMDPHLDPDTWGRFFFIGIRF